MKNTIAISALAAMLLTTQGAAFADDHGHGHGHGHGHDRHGPPHKTHHDKRYHDRYHGRGEGPHHSFHRGDHLSAEYRHRQYVVDNWRFHHLSTPPRGYHWVQTGPDYVLVAITTGIIAQIVLSN